ncbi:16S rRNA (cytosine(1402)-N(4))-methyltransferase RsmH [Candidatus Kuenenbacteria bacterium]|nr:16S rRNA (cytosine(1402)-N(4))-methyltransferase RsmH [Candidatus Kuenenbacteria bacterium]PJC00649.1 MAG: 16S rRNA (cytosine(1402)-N(4))-methyltransferase [bacterium (Candidatus Moisslbacteria) CG_4_9_14_0_8_um_filter_36_20]
MEHIPVLLNESIDFLELKRDGIYVDATLGGGGHAEKIASLIGKNGKVIGIDQDEEAIEKAKMRLAEFEEKIEYVHDNFKNLDYILNKLGVEKIDGILLDLGVSTYQLESPERGFSFSEKEANLSAPLDMRMDRTQSLTAYEVVNKYRESQLRDILWRLGEEPFARQISRKIVRQRERSPIKTTNDLLQVIKSATSPKYRFSRREGHYASKVFRAIRMEVNKELEAIEEVLPKAIGFLKKEGRLVVISFHSLEDRIVKQTFKSLANKEEPVIKILTKKPVLPTEEEIEKNPKARSAKLRAAEKLT